MRQTDFLATTDVSAEDVLEIIRDGYRHAEQLDPESERGIELTFESSVEEWRRACDLLPFAELWPALNTWFGVAFRASEWLEILEPAELKNLGGVCALIATRATRPTIRPFPVAGTECWSAGTFLTVRSLLVQAGVPVQNVRPSTPLAEYAREYPAVFIAEVGKLAPGALPVPKITHTAAHDISMALVCVAFAVLFLSLKWHVLFAVALLFLATGFGGVWITSRCPPKAVKFGDLVTFRDLADTILRATSR